MENGHRGEVSENVLHHAEEVSKKDSAHAPLLRQDMVDEAVWGIQGTSATATTNLAQVSVYVKELLLN